MIMIIEVKYLVFYSAAHGTMSCDKKRSGRIIRLHCNLRNYIVRELIMIIDIKGEVHPELKLFLIKAEQWEKHISEGLTKIRQRIQKLWIFKVLILWRHMRAALPYVVYCKFHKLPFSQNNMNYFTCAFDILSDTCFYTRLYEIDLFLHQEPWKRAIYGIYSTQHMGEQLASDVTKLKL